LTALHLAATQTYDAIVLDIGLPAVSGLEICRRPRRDAGSSTPIIMLTARDQLEDKLSGFDAGADDYVLCSHLYNLRRLIDRRFDHELLETISGVGVRIRAP
jgi:CheY-like chemotaxis protein